MKKFLIGSLLIGLSVSLFAADQCNGNNSPCDLTGTVIDDGTGSSNFVKYSGSNLKQYTTFNLVGSNKPYAYTVARHTNSKIVLNMSEKYGTIVTGYYTNGGINCNKKLNVKKQETGMTCGSKNMIGRYCCPSSANAVHRFEDAAGHGGMYTHMACAANWCELARPTYPWMDYYNYVDVSEKCTNNISIEPDTNIKTPPTLRLSK